MLASTALTIRCQGTESKNFWMSRSITQSLPQHRSRHLATASRADRPGRYPKESGWNSGSATASSREATTVCAIRSATVGPPEPVLRRGTSRVEPRRSALTSRQLRHSKLFDSPQQGTASATFTRRRAAQPSARSALVRPLPNRRRPRVRQSCEKSAPTRPDEGAAKSALGQQKHCHSRSRTATPWNRPPPSLSSAARPAVLLRAIEKGEAAPNRLPPASRRHSAVSAGQRALPRGFKGTGGSSGAGSGAPS